MGEDKTHLPAVVNPQRLGSILIRQKIITPEILAQAAMACEEGESLTHCLIRLNYVDEKDLATASAAEYGFSLINLAETEIPPEIISLIPENLARQHGFLPLSLEGHRLHIAVFDPLKVCEIEDLLRFSSDGQFEEFDVSVVEHTALYEAIDLYFHQEGKGDGSGSGKMTDLLKEVRQEAATAQAKADQAAAEKESEVDLHSLSNEAEESSLVRLVNEMLSQAVKAKASDIHFEPYEKEILVRFRIDGVLQEVFSLPLSVRNSFVSRLKIMANLDIAERRIPQDGRIRFNVQGKPVDFRLSILPILDGEKAVLRILDSSALSLDLSKIGFNEEQLEVFREAVHSPWGMVLVTGPTGSGKSTTLYSALQEVSTRAENISTVEDPVEMKIPGINQVAVNEAAGLTFANALRSFLRQDPDVIMVGEIRDFETAETAVKAALTGHLVFSTLHTNDAPSTINRLLNMGIEPFLVSSSVVLICAQRLVRRVCLHCVVEPVSPKIETLRASGLTDEMLVGATFRQGRGCAKCNNTGYKGRLGLFELLPVSEKIQEGIMQGFSSLELRQIAKSEGMITLRQAGLLKAREGQTTIEEVLRVTRAD